MPNYKEKIAEFENNFSTVIDKSVRDLSMAFDNLYLDKNAKEIPPTIKLAEALLSGEHNISTKMQIHYDIANAYHDLRMIEGVYSERYLEKELYHLRCALDMYETNYYDADSDSAEVKVAQYIAMRSYTNLGNAYRALGRHIVAIDCFQDALLISNDFAMASLNLSFLLFRCAPLQIKRYEQSYYARFIAMGVEFKVIAECKRYSSPVSREKVAVLADKVKSLGAHKGIMISTCGFQSGAYEYAKKHGIALLQVINRNVMHIMNAATPETEEQKQKLHLMLDWYNRMPKYYAKEYATMDFPDKTIYPSPKMLEAIRREFVLAHKDILPR